MSDLISRQAALDIVFDFAEAPHNMYQKIRELPTIEPKPSHDWNGWENGCGRTYDFEPKRGKWIYLDGLDAFECSVCGRQMVRNIFDYCPWCGAKMERSEE